ncbi:hypothetical protein NBO_559g0002 [Nosema bombycis CQ1]|uniref:Uncharacterized protein n=1 Tax=Nosema bombycis (strain CQ1 / CVCC 102059) TaxID=578461 RepID=R0MH05_NOSB1|nr:hypothetical protein NBO_559g0002 [Nosema bombycis CQ1]|eukprot:EOB12073.1 hypothetical protein NBO_559g0002 [Nosema bombycis CQ1]
MKFLEIKQILRTNEILKTIQEQYPIILDLEVYSCKNSKIYKMYKKTPKPLRYLLETLQRVYPDYSFIGEDWSNFKKLDYQNVANELIYSFLTFYKVKEKVDELVQFLGLIIDKTVFIDGCEIFSYTSREGPFEKDNWHFCFLFYSRSNKRVLFLSVRNTEIV